MNLYAFENRHWEKKVGGWLSEGAEKNKATRRGLVCERPLAIATHSLASGNWVYAELKKKPYIHNKRRERKKLSGWCSSVL